jgi:hypothetical protein
VRSGGVPGARPGGARRCIRTPCGRFQTMAPRREHPRAQTPPGVGRLSLKNVRPTPSPEERPPRACRHCCRLQSSTMATLQLSLAERASQAPKVAPMSKRIAGVALPRAPASRPQQQRRRNAITAPMASYGASGYGPVGGDARIKVVGVGGGGGNAVNRMISSGLQVSPMPAQIVRQLARAPAIAPPSCLGLGAGRRVLGRQHRRPGAGEPSGAQQAANRHDLDPRPR